MACTSQLIFVIIVKDLRKNVNCPQDDKLGFTEQFTNKVSVGEGLDPPTMADYRCFKNRTEHRGKAKNPPIEVGFSDGRVVLRAANQNCCDCRWQSHNDSKTLPYNTDNQTARQTEI
jgi:hypothetical protein